MEASASGPADAPMDLDDTTPSVRNVRVTNHGKMKVWITQTLSFLEDATEDKPRTVVLHTLPLSVDTVPAANKDSDKEGSSSKGLNTSTTTVSRLISVVEIIKREYIKVLEEKRSPRMVGLHQYNEIGTLESLQPGGVQVAVDEDTRTRDILRAMEGKHFPRQQQTPFMKITLSTHELPELGEGVATYQEALKRTMSKSAKARAKKRAKVQKKAEAQPS